MPFFTSITLLSKNNVMFFLFLSTSENSSDNMKILGEACVYKVESRRRTLIKQAGEKGEVTDDDVAVSLLADLQERQDREAERYIQNMPEKVRCNKKSIS